MGISLPLDTRWVRDICPVPISGLLLPISAVTMVMFLLLNLVVIPTSQRCSSWTWKSQGAPGDASLTFEAMALKFLL